MKPVFKWMAREGNIAQDELLRTFNCGIGMIVVAARGDAARVAGAFKTAGDEVVELGQVIRAEGEPRVVYRGALDLQM